MFCPCWNNFELLGSEQIEIVSDPCDPLPLTLQGERLQEMPNPHQQNMQNLEAFEAFEALSTYPQCTQSNHLSL